jgi:hypothetical protein
VPLVLAGAMLAGCTTGSRSDEASKIAVSFAAALERKDGAAACRLLTPGAQQAVPGATNASCSQAIVNVNAPGRRVRAVQVWGDAAQVRIGSDTIFLRQMPRGWLVSAAACKPQPKGPYQCEVSG